MTTTYFDRALATFDVSDSVKKDALAYAGFCIAAGALLHEREPDSIWATTPTENGTRSYPPRLDFAAGTHFCNCGASFAARTAGSMSLCKHELTVAILADDQRIPVTPKVRQQRNSTGQSGPRKQANALTASISPMQGRSINAQVVHHMQKAISALGIQVETLWHTDQIPMLIGPTGTGKTSAIKTIAKINQWNYFTLAGDKSIAESDLLGMHLNNGTDICGIATLAFRAAREGNVTILFLDEFKRFNQRMQDVLMTAVQRTEASVAKLMGIETDEDIYILRSPTWGMEWAPVSKLKWVFATNPWGANIDDAFGRRITYVDAWYSEDVLKPFDPVFADMVKQVWQACREGVLGLPIEYQMLAGCKTKNDTDALGRYLIKLRMHNRAYYEIASGILGIQIEA